jgi:hypothetical protein
MCWLIWPLREQAQLPQNSRVPKKSVFVHNLICPHREQARSHIGQSCSQIMWPPQNPVGHWPEVFTNHVTTTKPCGTLVRVVRKSCGHHKTLWDIGQSCSQIMWPPQNPVGHWPELFTNHVITTKPCGTLARVVHKSCGHHKTLWDIGQSCSQIMWPPQNPVGAELARDEARKGNTDSMPVDKPGQRRHCLRRTQPLGEQRPLFFYHLAQQFPVRGFHQLLADAHCLWRQ